MDDKMLKELVTSTKALMLMQVQLLAEPSKREKPEIVLSRAGFAPKQIARLLNIHAQRGTSNTRRHLETSENHQPIARGSAEGSDDADGRNSSVV